MKKLLIALMFIVGTVQAQQTIGVAIVNANNMHYPGYGVLYTVPIGNDFTFASNLNSYPSHLGESEFTIDADIRYPFFLREIPGINIYHTAGVQFVNYIGEYPQSEFKRFGSTFGIGVNQNYNAYLFGLELKYCIVKDLHQPILMLNVSRAIR